MEDYLKSTAEQLNKVFQLYKSKLKELPKKGTDGDKVSDWFGKALNDFSEISDSIEDAKVRTFVSHFCSSCLITLENYYTGSLGVVRYRWLGKKDISYLEEAEAGDSFKVGNKIIEVKRVD